MTIRRNPHSPAGAWFESARLLSANGHDGWEIMAEALGKPASTIRKWAEPGRAPDGEAMVVVDRDLLKPRGLPPVNTIAMGQAIGSAAGDLQSLYREGMHRLGVMVRLVEASRDEDLDLLELSRISLELRTLLLKLDVVVVERWGKQREEQRRPPRVATLRAVRD